MYYDIHSHLNQERFAGDLSGVIMRMRSEGVITNVVGWDIASSRQSLAIAEEYSDVCRAVVGVHPDDYDSYASESLESLARNPLVVGIGECGFDFYRTNREDVLVGQEAVFRSQLDIANIQQLPVMLHVRATEGTMDAYIDALRVLDDYPEISAHWHFFAGNAGVLSEIINRGHTVSFTGVVTFADEYLKLVAMMPGGQIMAETDAPWVAPVPYRGQRCEPWMVKEVVQKLINMINTDSGSGQPVDAQQIFANSQRIFNWDKGSLDK